VWTNVENWLALDEECYAKCQGMVKSGDPQARAIKKGHVVRSNVGAMGSFEGKKC
jgi:hypothetical protein